MFLFLLACCTAVAQDLQPLSPQPDPNADPDPNPAPDSKPLPDSGCRRSTDGNPDPSPDPLTAPRGADPQPNPVPDAIPDPSARATPGPWSTPSSGRSHNIDLADALCMKFVVLPEIQPLLRSRTPCPGPRQSLRPAQQGPAQRVAHARG